MAKFKAASFLLCLLIWWQTPVACQAAVSCSSNDTCKKLNVTGSECVNGFCSNPYHKFGCLRQKLPSWHKIRTCGSEDPPSAKLMGYCRPSPLDYMEIRILSQNWVSAFVGTWIVQILLSEMLDIPVSIETGIDGMTDDFYNSNGTVDFGTANDWEAFVRGVSLSDCRLRPNSSEPCAHMLPEAWAEDLVNAPKYQQSGTIESPIELGMQAQLKWYIPRFTARQDPTLTSYLGLQGQQNRRKLAETFLRPTKWGDYCSQVSNNSCRQPDGVAARAPVDADEEITYFVEGLYTGHFRATEASDCNRYPKNCTGEIIDYPCGLSSFVVQQAYWLDIGLVSSGDQPSGAYSYDAAFQILQAMDATKSNVIMLNTIPGQDYYGRIGTDNEFMPVALSPPTQECLDHRADPAKRCTGDVTAERGDPKGACDYAPQTIHKVIGAGLHRTLYKSNIPDGLRSPAYNALVNYKLTEFQVGIIITNYLRRKTNPDFDLREATCQWVVENIDIVKSFIPESYPRAIAKETFASSSFFIASAIAAGFGVLLLVGCCLGTFLKRKKKVIYRIQILFLAIFLFGLMIVLVGAVLLLVPQSDPVCASIPWFSNLGYGIALVPLYVRISAINRLLSTGKHMQRVRLTFSKLVGSVVAACCALAAFVALWTILDSQHVTIRYSLTGDKTMTGETIVLAKSFCFSKSKTWPTIGFGWQALLLLLGLLQAFMASRVQDDVNEAKLLTTLLSSLFVFSMMRCALLLLVGSLEPAQYTGCLSLFYSIDCSVALMIFLVPKLFAKSDEQDASDSGPDLFIDTTVMFAEVTGFAAWSSVRDPSQVFKLLEIVYGEFDDLAEQRKVFKVETVGDCYVAAVGIPQARSDHAVIAARFAVECMNKMHSVAHEYEIIFGPDTGNLSLKIGIHTGPVTGGFLKGKGARFQLFGDTMVTTGQVTRAGESGRIHISEDVANLLVKAGKERWVEKLPSKIVTTSGEIQTYWMNGARGKIKPGNDEALSSNGDSGDMAETNLWQISHDQEASRKQRLIDWNVEVLHGLLKQIVARRNPGATMQKSGNKKKMISDSFSDMSNSLSTDDLESEMHDKSTMPLDEVKEIIILPEFDLKLMKKQKTLESIVISPVVLNQLKYYVTTLAEMYRDNPFHNFDHASHVVMATIKHMNRITAPKAVTSGNTEEQFFDNQRKISAALHDHTYGITSDPLTQFACVFSALIHDLDHPGVPNAQLIKENEGLAQTYNSRSVAEQNSFDLAWNLLMGADFVDLRTTICASNIELTRFRQLVINSVMATDLGDKELKALRNGRWEKAFSINEDELSATSERHTAINRKATIVIEHLIQASDVSHTMQHWDVYREWNENLFREMYYAYRKGRADKNPADVWYEGEIGFFDYYIIPLSQKLRDCGVFGVSSDENLNYAKRNREEWASKGRAVVAEMLQKAELEMDKELGISSTTED